MVIRAWLAEAPGPSSLRARVTVTRNILTDQRSPDTRVFAEIDAVCAEVRHFLLDLLAPSQSAGDEAGESGPPERW
jgi:hypothetical protein